MLQVSRVMFCGHGGKEMVAGPVKGRLHITAVRVI